MLGLGDPEGLEGPVPPACIVMVPIASGWKVIAVAELKRQGLADLRKSLFEKLLGGETDFLVDHPAFTFQQTILKRGKENRFPMKGMYWSPSGSSFVTVDSTFFRTVSGESLSSI